MMGGLLRFRKDQPVGDSPVNVDAFAPDELLDEDEVRAALQRWPHVYQPAADARTPIWTLQHRKAD